MGMSFDSNDVSENRVKGGLGYLIFFLPLILCPGSRYGRFCANQGLIVLIAEVAISVAFWILGMILGWIPLLGGLLRAVEWIAKAAVALIAIYFCYLACSKGDARELPVVGKISIIK